MFNLGSVADKEKIDSLSPIVLAFVGDAVYSLIVRCELAFTNGHKTGVLNTLATSKVRASAQAHFLDKIFSFLTEEEIAVYKRARNTKKTSKSKSATVTEYNISTGFEAILGYLYLLGKYDRINFLIAKGNENES